MDINIQADVLLPTKALRQFQVITSKQLEWVPPCYGGQQGIDVSDAEALTSSAFRGSLC